MPLSPSEVLSGAAGVAIVLMALAWRARARRRSQSLLRAALSDPDPATRRAAIGVVNEVGLARHAAVLLEQVRRERDPRLLDALAQAIARNQWEPADRPTVFELRLWAHHRLDAQLAPVISIQPGPVLALAAPKPEVAEAPPPPAVIPAERPPTVKPVAVTLAIPALRTQPTRRFEPRAQGSQLSWALLAAAWFSWRVGAWDGLGRHLTRRWGATPWE